MDSKSAIPLARVTTDRLKKETSNSMNTASSVATGLALIAGFTCEAAAFAQQMKQIADPNFDAKVADPTFTKKHPRVLFDEAHHNASTTTGRYKPFVDLIINDGYRVTPNKHEFSEATLSGVRLLVIVNAAVPKNSAGDKHAFTEKECDVLRRWVRRGGALLLVADHAPNGQAAENLAKRFGIDMRNGNTYDDEHCVRGAYWQLVFSRENKLLADHPITRGRGPKERVRRVMTFGGQSLKGPQQSTVLLKLAETAYDRLANDKTKTIPAAGRAQAVAMRFGKGRVVVLGEAAMLSAQVLWIGRVIPRTEMGMNVSGIDNRQFALNLMHWLSGILD